MKNEDFLKKPNKKYTKMEENMRETHNTRRRAKRVLFKSMIIVLFVLVLNEMALFTRTCAPRFVK
jgi:hypothetical protein